MLGQLLLRIALIGPLLLLPATLASAQDIHKLENQSVVLAPDQVPEIQDFDFDRTWRMTVAVRINESKPYPFIVDTGSERTVIANDLAQTLDLEAGRTLVLATITGRIAVNSFMIDNLMTSVIDIGGIEAPGLERSHMGAYGLLGIDSLEDRKVLLDFQKQKMEVIDSPRRRGRGKYENGMIVVNAYRQAGRMILSTAEIDGHKVDIIVDTGAQNSMGNTALKNRLRRRDIRSDYVPITLRSVAGIDVVGDFAQIKKIQIGGFSIKDLPITFADNYAFEALDLNNRPAILLGMDALKLFDRVLVDFTNRRVGFDLPGHAG